MRVLYSQYYIVSFIIDLVWTRSSTQNISRGAAGSHRIQIDVPPKSPIKITSISLGYIRLIPVNAKPARSETFLTIDVFL